MKVSKIETLACKAGWRPWIFVKITTDSGIVGYADCTDSFGSNPGIRRVIQDLAPLVVGQDPLATERIFWDLYRFMRQSAGGIAQKAIGGIENALLDIKGKALGVPVYSLLGGPTKDSVRVYWSHCGTTRARTWDHVGKPPIRTLDDVAALGREVVERGYTALKTNIIFPGEPPEVVMQGFKGGPGSADRNVSRRILSGLESLIGTFRDAVGPQVDIMLDLNFNFRMEGNVQIARVLEPFDLTWLEIDAFDPAALRHVKDKIRTPVASCENLFGLQGYRPFLEAHAADIAVIDVLWNGLVQSKKIADLADACEMSVAPHNHYSPLATLMAGHFCLSAANVRILELDVDEVPWADELVTNPARVVDGHLHLPSGPGWGADLNEEVLQAHAWPG